MSDRATNLQEVPSEITSHVTESDEQIRLDIEKKILSIEQTQREASSQSKVVGHKSCLAPGRSQNAVSFGPDVKNVPKKATPPPAAPPAAAPAPGPVDPSQLKDEVEMLRAGYKNSHGENIKSQANGAIDINTK